MAANVSQTVSFTSTVSFSVLDTQVPFKYSGWEQKFNQDKLQGILSEKVNIARMWQLLNNVNVVALF